MASVLASSVVDRGSVQTNDYKIGIYCLSANNTGLRGTSTFWLARNKANVSKLRHVYQRTVCFSELALLTSRDSVLF
jgi:hypothetical protein